MLMFKTGCAEAHPIGVLKIMHVVFGYLQRFGPCFFNRG